MSREKMPQNQVLLKGGHARNVVKETPDTRMVLMDGLFVREGEKMSQNQVLLKGRHASNVVKETPDTRMVLMNGLFVRDVLD